MGSGNAGDLPEKVSRGFAEVGVMAGAKGSSPFAWDDPFLLEAHLGEAPVPLRTHLADPHPLI